MNHLEILEDIGLTAGEIKTYVALLELGESSAGPIKKKTRLQNSVVHLCLGNLIEKGLISYVEKGRRRFYTATAPHHLLDFVDEKRRRLQEILPALIQKQKEKIKYEVHIHEGNKGLKAVHEDLLADLQPGEEFLVLGAPLEAHESFEPYFLDFHKRRVKKGIKVRILYRKEAASYAKVRKQMPYTQISYLPETFSSPMWTTISKDKTIIFVVGDVMLGIVIENKAIANSFRGYFELLWKMAKI